MLGLLIRKDKIGETMSQYKYGMYVRDIAKIKREIVVLKKSDEDVMKKWGISKGQLGFIHDVLLKGQFRTIERRVSNLERGFSPLREIAKGSLLYCDRFGTGEVTRLFTDNDLMLVKFSNIDIPFMCSRKHMTTVHDEVKSKLRLIISI